MDEQASQFRKHARDSRELARVAATDAERLLYEDVAAHWEALADLWAQLRGLGHHHHGD